MCQNKCKEDHITTADLAAQAAHPLDKLKLSSQELLQGTKELLIEHNGCCYCLRVTKQNKLILTK